MSDRQQTMVRFRDVDSFEGGRLRVILDRLKARMAEGEFVTEDDVTYRPTTEADRQAHVRQYSSGYSLSAEGKLLTGPPRCSCVVPMGRSSQGCGKPVVAVVRSGHGAHVRHEYYCKPHLDGLKRRNRNYAKKSDEANAIRDAADRARQRLNIAAAELEIEANLDYVSGRGGALGHASTTHAVVRISDLERLANEARERSTT